MRRLAAAFLILPGLVCLAPGAARGQEGSIQLVEATDAACNDPAVRARRSGARESFCIVGVARHSAGVARVLMNGVQTALQAQADNGFRFIGFVPVETARSGLELIVYPSSGQPVVQGYALVTETRDSASGGPVEFWSRKNPLAQAEVASVPDAGAQAAEHLTLAILEPREWMGEGKRGPVPTAGSLRVVGRVHHPSGITRVLVNGEEAALQAHPSGSMHFITYVPGATAGGMEVMVYPAVGDPVRKLFGTAAAAVAAATPAPQGVPAPGDTAAAAVAAPEPAAPAGPAAGPTHYLELLEPTEWAGSGTRGLAAPVRRSIRVVGEAMHATGARTVLINGARASLQRRPNGAVRFVGYVPVGTDSRTVDIQVDGQTGAPIRRQFAVEPVAAPAPGPGDLAAPRTRGQRWAVVVGVSKYADGGITPLRYADRDAEAFYRFLLSERAGGGGFKPENVKLLLNEEATFQGLRTALFTFLKSSTEDDQVIIYFAGHGAPDPQRRDDLYLLAYDTRAADLSGSGFPMYEVKNAVEKVLARDILVITDACHSAGVGSSDGTRSLETNQINDIFLNQLNSSTGGQVIFTASMANQTSSEHERWGGGHGIFTHHLLEALNGAADEDGDRIVSLLEMMEWTRDRVRRETQNAQIPSISTTSYDPLWPMSIVLDSASAAAAGTVPAPRPQTTRPTDAVRSPAGPVRPAVDPDVLQRAREKVQLYPDSPKYWSELGHTLRKAGETDEAISALQNAARLAPQDAAYRHELGVLLRDTDRTAAALVALQEAVRLAPRIAEYHNGLGVALLRAGQVPSAVDALRRAVSLNPGQGTYHRDLGMALARHGNFGKAIESLESAIRLEPSVARHHQELAQVLGQAGRPLDGIAALQAAARLDAQNAGYQKELAEVLRLAGRMQEAIAAYREAARLRPEDAGVRHAAGVLLRDLGQQYETLEAFREAVRLDPRNALFRFDLAVALSGSARPEDSMEHFREALAVEPGNAAYHEGFGLALQRIGRPAEAMDQLREALRLAPGTARYHYGLALVLKESGQLDQALAEADAALKLEKGNDLYKQQVRELQQLRRRARPR
ncbi:MAG: tetratricopeptide repeat protein [Gemmatimonadota bacterium]